LVGLTVRFCPDQTADSLLAAQVSCELFGALGFAVAGLAVHDGCAQSSRYIELDYELWWIMSKALRRTPATLDVLHALSSCDGLVWGLQLVRDTGRPAGSIYPILSRLEEAGWVSSEWETVSDHGGPRRRYYKLTVDGQAHASTMLESRTARSVRAATAEVRFV
jgi:DNA-binding MarR family transcriptional regulator